MSLKAEQSGRDIFPSTAMPITASYLMRIEVSFLKVKRLESAANHSSPFSNEMWTDRSRTSNSVYVINKTQEIFNFI
jgi:hypothetical protein